MRDAIGSLLLVLCLALFGIGLPCYRIGRTTGIEVGMIRAAKSAHREVVTLRQLSQPTQCIAAVKRVEDQIRLEADD